MQHIENLKRIYIKSVKSVIPQNLLTSNNGYNLKPIEENGQQYIKIQQNIINVSKKRCHVAGFGKAVLGMAVALERSLGKQLVNGILSLPKGTLKTFSKNASMQLCDKTVLKIYEGAEHNQPDDVTVQAALDIKSMVQTFTKDDILFVLISGGGSALLTLPRWPLNVEFKLKLIKELASKGASIQEINSVRIALSDIKGGKLALAARKSYAIISFILSDIVDDPVHLIASGPTCTVKSLMNPQNILQKYDLWECLTWDIKNIIVKSVEQLNYALPELPHNYINIIGNNEIACVAAQQAALSFNYSPFIVSNSIQGDIEYLVDEYYKFIKSICANQINSLTIEKFKETSQFNIRNGEMLIKHLQDYQTTKKPLLLILSGEPTVKVLGNGLGGRNQEFALRLSKNLYDDPYMKNVYFLSAGTDGIDGPTPAAGALGCAAVVKEFLQNHNIDELQYFISNNDSYNFYRALSNGKYHIITGHTGTNVMDMHFILLL